MVDMVKPRLLGKTTRMSFAKNDEVLEMPNLIEVQKKSFEDFITKDIRTRARGHLSDDRLQRQPCHRLYRLLSE